MRAFTIIDAPQRSDEWRLARVGRLTGSRADHALAFKKDGNERAERRDYRIQLCCERLVGRPLDSDYVNDDMRRGIDLEPEARNAYEASTGQLVQQTGFLRHDTLMVGASLDGHVGDFVGLLECKAPRPANHLEILRAGCVPVEHEAQLLHALWLTGAEWIDFVSYSPAFPEDLQLFIVRLKTSEHLIAEYERKAQAFLADVQKEYDAVSKLRRVPLEAA